MLISTMAFACMNAIVKHLSEVSSYQIVFFRSLSSLFFTFGFLIKNNVPVIGKNNFLLIMRSVTGAISMLFFFMSVKYLSVGTAVSLRYLSPIFAAVLAVFLLRESVRPWQWAFFCISFIGVLVLKGFDSQINSYGLVLILMASVLSGLVYVIISKIGNSEHPVVIVNYFMVIAAILGGVLSISNWVSPKGWEWLFLLSLGVFGYFGQIFMTKAFQTASTNLIAPIKYVEVIFTTVLGIMLFNELYTFWALLGISLIIGGMVLNVWYKSKFKR